MILNEYYINMIADNDREGCMGVRACVSKASTTLILRAWIIRWQALVPHCDFFLPAYIFQFF